MTASIENPSWLEYMGWYDHLWVEPNNPKNGMMSPPDRPGHGMDFRQELFLDYPYRCLRTCLLNIKELHPVGLIASPASIFGLCDYEIRCSDGLLLLRHDAAATKRTGLEGLKNIIIPFYDDLENSWAKLF